MKSSYQNQTKMVHGGVRRSYFGEVSEAIFMTQSYIYDTAENAEIRFQNSGEDEFIYSRYGNPTVAMFEDRMALLEGAEDCFATASGMAAVNGALASCLTAGDHVVASKALFGSCLYILEQILPKFGVEVTFVDGPDVTSWKRAFKANTKVCFFESMSNPNLELVDIPKVVEIAHSYGALVVVDNVFTTPVFSNAIELGVDVVVYSATKHIDGQGRALGGVVLGKKDFIRNTVEPYIKHTGSSMSPFNAWIMLKGLETIELRVKAQAKSAFKISQFLETSSEIKKVIYPGLQSNSQHELAKQITSGFGTVTTFEFIKGKKAAFKFLNNLDIIILSNNLGDAKSIATHPATTTHQRLSEKQKEDLLIGDGLVRLSVGLEDTDDLINDVSSALTTL